METLARSKSKNIWRDEMILLNLRFQIDTPYGVEDVHAFVADEGDKYIVYCRYTNNQQPQTVIVPDFDTAIIHINHIIAACKREVEAWESQPQLFSA